MWTRAGFAPAENRHPGPAQPDAVADVVKQLTTAFNWSGPVGITFPGVVTDGVTRTAANLDPSWIG